MNIEQIKNDAKSQGLKLCAKEILDIKKTSTIGMAHWHEGRAHGIILTLYQMQLLDYFSFQRENLNVITIASEQREKIIENDKIRKRG